MKKFLYTFLGLFLVFVVTLVVAWNSSFVIQKGFDRFAPNYGIGCQRISGNLFTGITLEGLTFKEKPLASKIRFAWNPSTLLYGRLRVGELGAYGVNVDNLTEMIASFPSSESNSSENKEEGTLPIAISLGHLHLDLLPFERENIYFKGIRIDLKGLLFRAPQSLDIDSLDTMIDTNLTKFHLLASLDSGNLTLNDMTIDKVDTEAIEALVTQMPVQEEKPTKQTSKSSLKIPFVKHITLKQFALHLLPRAWQGYDVSEVTLSLSDAQAELDALMAQRASALKVSSLSMLLKSDLFSFNLKSALEDDQLLIERCDITKIDIQALQTLSNKLRSDRNETNTTVSEPQKKEVTEPSGLIPKKVLVKRFHTDFLPLTQKVVKLEHLALDIDDLEADIPQMMIEKGTVLLQAESNLSNISQEGTIRENKFRGTVVISPKEGLFKQYDLPIRKEALGNVKIDLDIDRKRLIVDMNNSAKALLLLPKEKNATKAFNVDIDKLQTHLQYTMASKTLDANTTLIVTTPYTKGMKLTNRFKMAYGKIAYEGALQLKAIEGIDANLTRPLQDLRIDYEGSDKSLHTTLESHALTGEFSAADFKGVAKLTLGTKRAIAFDKMVTLPPELNGSKVNVKLDLPIDLAKVLPLDGKLALHSNLANVDASFHYDRSLQLNAMIDLPQDSLLKGLDKHIVWEGISPMHIALWQKADVWHVTIKAKEIGTDISYDPQNAGVQGEVKVAGLNATINEESDELVVRSNIDSFRSLKRSISSLYHLEGLPDVEGRLALALRRKKSGEVTLELDSKKVVIHSDRKNDQIIENLSLALQKVEDKIVLSRYDLDYNTMHFYATKPSTIALEGSVVTIPQVWVNDALKISGSVDLKQMKGAITASADRFSFTHEMIDLESAIDITMQLDGNSTDINGKVVILGGNIHYDLGTKTFPSDSDIVIVQEMKKKEPSPFMDHLNLFIRVETNEPLVYKQGPVDVKAKVEMNIHKAIYSDPMIIGSIDLIDGGSYIFEGKRFTLKKSHIYLTGDPSKPILDLTIQYKALRHLISIHVSGTPSTPTVLFSSIPSLKKEQILSIILFDSEEGAGTNNANDMMKMMGGAMAKSALNDLGVQIDHLVLGEGNSVEVGKKLTDKTTVIYINGEIPKMELKYEYSPHIEIVVGASEQSESLDVVYRKDFNMRQDNDIVIKGRKK